MILQKPVQFLSNLPHNSGSKVHLIPVTTMTYAVNEIKWHHFLKLNERRVNPNRPIYSVNITGFLVTSWQNASVKVIQKIVWVIFLVMRWPTVAWIDIANKCNLQMKSFGFYCLHLCANINSVFQLFGLVHMKLNAIAKE